MGCDEAEDGRERAGKGRGERLFEAHYAVKSSRLRFFVSSLQKKPGKGQKTTKKVSRLSKKKPLSLLGEEVFGVANRWCPPPVRDQRFAAR